MSEIKHETNLKNEIRIQEYQTENYLYPLKEENLKKKS